MSGDRSARDIRAALQPLRPLVHGPESELQGVLVDQAAVHGIIARLHGLGVEAVALQRLADDRSAAWAKA